MHYTVQQSEKTYPGFSLAELLISLALLGILASLTVPKLLMAPSGNLSQKQTTQTKNVALMISLALEKYRATTGTIPTSLRSIDLIPYLNYVRLDSTSTYDHVYGYGSLSCSDEPCLRLHNGGLLSVSDYYHFGGNTTNNFVLFIYDPDGSDSGTTNGPGKSIALDLQYDGRVIPSPSRTLNHVTYDVSNNPNYWGPDATPSWFMGF